MSLEGRQEECEQEAEMGADEAGKMGHVGPC